MESCVSEQFSTVIYQHPVPDVQTFPTIKLLILIVFSGEKLTVIVFGIDKLLAVYKISPVSTTSITKLVVEPPIE